MARNTETGGRDATTAVVPGKIALSIGHPGTPLAPGFEWTALSGVARLESGHTPSRSHPEYWDGDIPWLSIPDASAHHGTTLLDTQQHISQAGVDHSSTRLLPSGTVCLSRTASVGYVVTMGRPMCTSQDFLNWVCGPGLDPRFLHYVLMLESESIRELFAFGTTHKTLYYPDAKALHIALPSIREQRAIAEVLGALDDKIAANERLMRTSAAWRATRVRLLEQGHVGEQTLGEMSEFMGRGRAPRYSETVSDPWVINQKCVRGGSVELAEARRTSGGIDGLRLLQSGDVLVNSTGMGTLGRAGIWTVPQVATCDSHVSIVRFGGETPLCRAQQLVDRQALLEALGEGSTGQTELSRALLAAFKLPALSAGAAGAEEDLRAAHKHERQVKDESQTLAALRDALLPGLMDGSIGVKDAEASVSDAL